MAATLRGEATVAGTGMVLVIDAAAIEHIEAAADASIFDLLGEVQPGRRKKPKLSTMATLVHGAHLRAQPDMTRDEAYAIAMGGDAAVMSALGEAVAAAFGTPEAGAGAKADPPKKPGAAGS